MEGFHAIKKSVNTFDGVIENFVTCLNWGIIHREIQVIDAHFTEPFLEEQNTHFRVSNCFMIDIRMEITYTFQYVKSHTPYVPLYHVFI